MRYSPSLNYYFQAPYVSDMPGDTIEVDEETEQELHARQMQGWTPRYENGAFVFYAPGDPPGDVRLRNARFQRDELLKASDWTQGADASDILSADQIAAWTAYRSEVRKVLTQPDIRNLEWPVPPT